MSPMPSIRTLLRFRASRDAESDQGALGAGGFSPEVLTDFVSVVVAVPLGVLVSVVLFVLVSSEQPENPMQRPMAITPIIVTLINFLMDVSLDLGDKAAGDLT
jgi:hypothetical protein